MTCWGVVWNITLMGGAMPSLKAGMYPLKRLAHCSKQRGFSAENPRALGRVYSGLNC